MLRLVKNSDLKEIVEIRYSIREKNPLGIFAKMGRPFIKAYYKIVIDDPSTVFLCYEDEKKGIQGFAFAILDSEGFQLNIKKNKIKLMLASISSIIVEPSLVKALYQRLRSVESQSDDFIYMKGARLGYWGWNPQQPDPEASASMHEVLLHLLKCLGVEKVYLEVDKENRAIYKFHKINGAVVEIEKKLSDNRTRALMYYNINER